MIKHNSMRVFTMETPCRFSEQQYINAARNNKQDKHKYDLVGN